MYRHSKENWVPDFVKRRPDVSMETIEKYLHNLYNGAKSFQQQLDGHGISKRQAENWQKLAAVPQPEFEAALARPEKRKRNEPQSP
jgi:hypothetical protein